MHNCISCFLSIKPLIGMRQGTFTPCNFGIGLCQLNLYQKFPNCFGGENWHQLDSFDTLPSSLSLIKFAPSWRWRWAFFLLPELMPIRVKDCWLNKNKTSQELKRIWMRLHDCFDHIVLAVVQKKINCQHYDRIMYLYNES